MWTISLIFILIIYSPFILSANLYSNKTLKNADHDIILEGVDELKLNGAIGFLTVYGPETSTILVGLQNEEPILLPMAAAGRFGRGKILGYSHTAFLSPDASDDPPVVGVRQLILNSVRWASQTDTQTPSVAVLTDGDSLVEFLNENNMATTQIPLDSLTDVSVISQYDVVCIKQFFDLSKVPILLEYVTNGGGLIISITAWAYNPVELPFGSKFPPNVLSASAGFLWQSDYAAGPTLANGNYNTSTQLTLNTNVGEGWSEIQNYLVNGTGSNNFQQNEGQITAIFEIGIQYIPKSDPFFSTNLYSFAKLFAHDESKIPIATEATPVVDEGDKFLLRMFHIFATVVLSPEDMPVYEASKVFPGEPSQKREPLVGYHFQVGVGANQKIKMAPSKINSDTLKLKYGSRDASEIILRETHSRWYSTGLYAPAGQVVKVTIQNFTGNSGDIPQENLERYGVRIGCHKDDIGGHEQWVRPPIITTEVTFVPNDVTVLASPYGGPLYIVFPEEAANVTLSVSIDGVIKAPHFKLGETSLKEWREIIRYEPGPWTEFEAESLVLSAPSYLAQKIDDPEDLMTFWSNVMDMMADLAAIPRRRFIQERMVPDVDIGGGWMHSGYPVMTYMAVADWPINVTRMRAEGSWGHFHELGHNHQNSLWTFEGTGEVTCNLFVLYITNNLLGIEAGEATSLLTPEIYRPHIQKYLDDGAQFSTWQGNNDLGLLHYYQLETFYGWTSFKISFGKYHDLEEEEYPETTQQKIDLWVITFSSVVGENLIPFFLSWGFPLSENVSQLIGHLPETLLRMENLLDD